MGDGDMRNEPMGGRRSEDALAAQITGILSAQIGRVEGEMHSGFARLATQLDKFDTRLRRLEDWRIKQETREDDSRTTSSLKLTRRQATIGAGVMAIGLGGLIVGTVDFVIRVLGGY